MKTRPEAAHPTRFNLACRASWLLALILFAPQTLAQDKRAEPLELSVMTWNIWHGGREDGKQAGPARVTEIIKQSGADIVAMQETYGSGELIAKGLGFHFHPRGTNVSIHSRYPIVEDISVHKEFECVGALIELPDETRLAFYAIWLPYSAEIWAKGTRNVADPGSMLAACKASADSLATMHKAIEAKLSAAKYRDAAVIIAGDFNSMSHLDYGEIGIAQHEVCVSWPTSHVLTQAGFVDAYRECHHKIDRTQDSTWTPRFPEQQQDRIDFVYYRAAASNSRRWQAVDAKVLRDHTPRFPSDHAALMCKLRAQAPDPSERPARNLRIATYNIRHGVGMDNKLDLDRTAAVLRAQDLDIIGMQEVDLCTKRCGGVNQANELGALLSMHPSFGAFMPYQDGHYGMAILSRHPIVATKSLRLPTGNEPRIALLTEIRLPDGSTIVAVNVHFDWVSDDSFRFAQAKFLASHLRKIDQPFVLLGDFNDVPDSRTLSLFHELAKEVQKPASTPNTYPSGKPDREIDYIFVAPAAKWQFRSAIVLEEEHASDHRPIIADLTALRD